MQERKLVAINYADMQFTKSQKMNTWSLKNRGHADKIINYNRECIDDVFMEKNRDILIEQIGGGYWLWKPYIVKKTLDSMKMGDILFYLDSGAMVRKQLQVHVEFMDKNSLDLLCFSTPFREKSWTKKEVLEEYFERDGMDVEGLQIEATYFLIRKTKKTVDFVQEWLDLCCVRKNIANNEDGREGHHRNDQSLFSYVCKKYGYTPFKSPSNRYLRDSFSKELVVFYQDETEKIRCQEEYKALPSIPGTEFSIFCHGLRNTSMYSLKFLKMYMHALHQYMKHEDRL